MTPILDAGLSFEVLLKGGQRHTHINQVRRDEKKKKHKRELKLWTETEAKRGEEELIVHFIIQ